MASAYQRPESKILHERLYETPRFLIVVAGPRQVGKTTMVRDVLANGFPKRYTFVAVDSPEALPLTDTSQTTAPTRRQLTESRDGAWLVDVWQRAREAARGNVEGHILVLDEIQKIPRWSDTVKGLWDADRAAGQGK